MSGYGESGTETEQSGDGRWRPLDGGREDPSTVWTVMIEQGGKGGLTKVREQAVERGDVARDLRRYLRLGRGLG